MHPRTKLKLDNSKFAPVAHFTANLQKIENPKKFKPFNQFGPNLIPKVFDQYIIVQFKDYSSNFTKFRATTDVFQKIQNSFKFQIEH